MPAAENSKSKIEELVESELGKKGNAIRNKAALGALIKIIPVGGDALHHSLTAGTSAEETERAKIKLELLCQLTEKIDQAISKLIDEGKMRGVDFVEINGTISAQGTNAESVTGLEITGRGGVIQPGTTVRVEGRNVRNITGVKIG